jgi:hypothetical protein
MERQPIQIRYTNTKKLNAKRFEIERILTKAGARFAVNTGLVGSIGGQEFPITFSDVDWNEGDDGIEIEAYLPVDMVQQAISELRCCGCVVGRAAAS